MRAATAAISSEPLKAKLAPHLAGTRALRSFYAYAEIASTMDAAADLAKQGAPEGTLVWTARQTAGRGRQGRAWVSPEGGIYLSLIVRPPHPQEEVPQLALVAGLAVAETIRHEAKLLPAVRWPNDVLLAGKKVAGILVEWSPPRKPEAPLHHPSTSLGTTPRLARGDTPSEGASASAETRVEGSKHGVAIVGIGLNVTAALKDLPDVGTSLSAQGARQLDRFALTGALCRAFDQWYTVWANDGFVLVREALRPLMALFGQVVHITAGTSHFEGTATDLDERGRLVVRLDSGVHRAFEMGEVS